MKYISFYTEYDPISDVYTKVWRWFEEGVLHERSEKILWHEYMEVMV